VNLTRTGEGHAEFCWNDLSVCRQFTFVVLFSTFLLTCVNYDVLFKEGKYNASQKVTISDAIYPIDTWTDRYISPLSLYNFELFCTAQISDHSSREI